MDGLFSSYIAIGQVQLMVLFITSIWFCLPLVLSLWVYVDATRHGFNAPWAWVLITLAFSVFGVILYIIARNSHKTQEQIDQTYSKIGTRPHSRSKRKHKGPIETY